MKHKQVDRLLPTKIDIMLWRQFVFHVSSTVCKDIDYALLYKLDDMTKFHLRNEIEEVGK